jgi:hypothetical protein
MIVATPSAPLGRSDSVRGTVTVDSVLSQLTHRVVSVAKFGALAEKGTDEGDPYTGWLVVMLMYVAVVSAPGQTPRFSQARSPPSQPARARST